MRGARPDQSWLSCAVCSGAIASTDRAPLPPPPSPPAALLLERIMTPRACNHRPPAACPPRARRMPLLLSALSPLATAASARTQLATRRLRQPPGRAANVNNAGRLSRHVPCGDVMLCHAGSHVAPGKGGGRGTRSRDAASREPTRCSPPLLRLLLLLLLLLLPLLLPRSSSPSSSATLFFSRAALSRRAEHGERSQHHVRQRWWLSRRGTRRTPHTASEVHARAATSIARTVVGLAVSLCLSLSLCHCHLAAALCTDVAAESAGAPQWWHHQEFCDLSKRVRRGRGNYTPSAVKCNDAQFVVIFRSAK